MGLSHSPRIVTDGLVLLLDAANTKSVPKTNILTTWVDYGGNQTNYEVLGAYLVKLKNTASGWVGYFPATVSSTGKYVITFTYYSDSDGSSLVLDNDGIMDNTYNTTLTVNITPQTYTGSVDVNTTGNIQHFFRRNGGGNIYVTNVSYFKLETTWTDLSGGGNTGTLTNGPTYSSANGGSLVFDGVNDEVLINSNTIARIGTGNHTITAWVNNDIVTEEDIFGTNGTTTGDVMLMIYSVAGGGNGGFRGHAWSSTGAQNTIDSPRAIGTGNWSMLTQRVTWGGNIDLFENGVLTASATLSGGAPTSSRTQAVIGCRVAGGGSSHFQGKIPIVQIYNRALSAAEISQNFNALRGRFGI